MGTVARAFFARGSRDDDVLMSVVARLIVATLFATMGKTLLD